ncbi:hypothetical protein HY212_03780 [Candidatus Pacearchaeota archaeon]|nr:hypothetical protein [Candidatus Pacearchaeota archaeon]
MGILSRIFERKPKTFTWDSRDHPQEKLTPDKVRKIVTGLRGRYEESVKPYILSGNFQRAHLEMGDIAVCLEVMSRDVLLNIHCGLTYIQGARKLTDALATASSVPQEELEFFEAYQAQTKLPYRPGF